MRARLAALLLAALAAGVLLELGARLLVPVREIGPSFSVYDPVLGARHKRNLSASRWTPEFTMRITTNSLGQRGPEPTPAERDAKLRVLFVGDSFSEGYGVDDGEEFPRRVASRLAAEGRSVRVLNEGVGNTGTGRAVRLLRDYPSGPEGATVLVYQSSSNDFADDHRDGFFRLDPDGRLVEAPLPVPRSFLRRMQPVIDRIPGLTYSHAFAALLQLARSRGRAADAAPTAVADANDAQRERLTLRLLAELIAGARARGWPVIVLTSDAEADIASRIESVALAESAAFVRMPAKSERPDLYYRVDGHWNRDGHVEAAERLRGPLDRALLAAIDR
ncbi:MAG: hypothetical protein FJ108_12965 [Deltaproteobacteria bacterium]|nr:hypothetical protein [Deltaproteobacteria bacterium]